jgi:predicted O-methyltransferase YrrM
MLLPSHTAEEPRRCHLEPARSVVWTAENEFSVGNTDFAVVEFGHRPSDGAGTKGLRGQRKLAIHKSREQVEAYVDLVAAFPASRIVELGIKAGGSTALLASLVQPSRLVAVDIARRAAQGLETFLDTHGMRGHIRPYYGVDQADRNRLSRIIAEEFKDEPIDLVIDDASHLLEPTRASFEVLFRRLRGDGLFVIEDWSWEHAVASKVLTALGLEAPSELGGQDGLLEVFANMGVSRETIAPLRRGEFLSDLVSDIIVSKADGEAAIGDVTIRPFGTEVQRGPTASTRNALVVALARIRRPRVLHVGRLDARVADQILRAGADQLVVASDRAPNEGDVQSAVSHVPYESTSASPAELIRRVGEAAFDVVIDGDPVDPASARELAGPLVSLVPPGGVYMLRGWQRLIGPRSMGHPGLSGRRMPRLFLELILGVAEWADMIEYVGVGDEWLMARRGTRPILAQDVGASSLCRDPFDSLSRS